MSNWWVNFWCWVANEEVPKEPVVAPYCPIVELLESEPNSWSKGQYYEPYHNMYGYEYKAYYRELEEVKKERKRYPIKEYPTTSLVNLELGIEIKGATADHHGNFRTLEVVRNGHSLPINAARIRKAIKKRAEFLASEAARIKREGADAELNRLSNDVHSIRVKRMMEMRKQLALDEQAEIEANLVSSN